MSVELDLPVESLSELISPEALRAHQKEVDALNEQKRSFTDAAAINPDTASVDDMRYLLKHLIKMQAEQAAASARPVGVDRFSHLPVHFDPPECPLCMPFMNEREVHGVDAKGAPTHRSRPVCHDCNEPIPYEGEFFGRGIESSSVTHLHMHTVNGGRGEQIRVPGRRELCVPCFRIDYEKTTGKPCDL